MCFLSWRLSSFIYPCILVFFHSSQRFCSSANSFVITYSTFASKIEKLNKEYEVVKLTVLCMKKMSFDRLLLVVPLRDYGHVKNKCAQDRYKYSTKRQYIMDCNPVYFGKS